MLLVLFCLVAVSVFGNRHIARTGLSDEEILSAAKELVMSINPHAATPPQEVDHGQVVLDRMAAQIAAMSSGPQKTAALAALANMRQHAQQNKKKFTDKAKRVLGGGGLTTTKDKYLNVPESSEQIADMETKMATLQNSTLMASYKATAHAAAMEKIGQNKRNLVVAAAKRK